MIDVSHLITRRVYSEGDEVEPLEGSVKSNVTVAPLAYTPEAYRKVFGRWAYYRMEARYWFRRLLRRDARTD